MKARVKEETSLMEFLLRMLDTASKDTVKKLVRHHRVSVNGTIASRPDELVKAGSAVEILPVESLPRKAKALLPFKILYEDEHVIAVDKPQGLLTIGTEKERTRTLYRMVSDYVKESGKKIFIVHRLDRDASGVIVFAKDEGAKRKLQSDWDNVRKVYLALLDGKPKEKLGTIRGHLCEGGVFKVFECKPGADGAMLAVTHYKVLRSAEGETLAEIEIETGRKHQIRVHMASMKCPIVGDEKYGKKSPGGLRLHAWLLSFRHPITGRAINIKSAQPSWAKGVKRTKP